MANWRSAHLGPSCRWRHPQDQALCPERSPWAWAGTGRSPRSSTRYGNAVVSRYLWLRLDTLQAGPGFRRLSSRLGAMGNEVAAIQYGSPAAVRQQIRGADVLLLGDSSVLMEAEAREAVLQAIRGRKRMVVFADDLCKNPQAHEDSIDFLRVNFGIGTTEVRLYPPYQYKIDLADQPISDVIRGVPSIVMERPCQLEAGRDAISLIEILEPNALVDDIFVDGPERGVLAVGWPKSDGFDLRVIAFSGAIVAPLSAPDEPLCANDVFITTLLHRLAVPNPDESWSSTPSLVSHPLERLLMLVVRLRLHSTYGENPRCPNHPTGRSGRWFRPASLPSLGHCYAMEVHGRTGR